MIEIVVGDVKVVAIQKMKDQYEVHICEISRILNLEEPILPVIDALERADNTGNTAQCHKNGGETHFSYWSGTDGDIDSKKEIQAPRSCQGVEIILVVTVVMKKISKPKEGNLCRAKVLPRSTEDGVKSER